jgi:putative phosphoserine phosphatase/1-acylglycerol-3-phosphate O-acyltransferase
MVVPYRLGMLDKLRFFMSWGEDLAGLYKGVRLPDAEPEFQAVADELLAAGREDAMKMLHWHQSEGHVVVMVSGTLLPVLDAVSRALDVPHVVGTPLDVRDGRYTGRLQGPMCFGDEKARQLRTFLKDGDMDVDLSASYAYADRHHDVALLEMVGHPMATYPDDLLLAYAREKGWPILGDTNARR